MPLLRLDLRSARSQPPWGTGFSSLPSFTHSGVVQDSLMSHCCSLSVRFEVEGGVGIAADSCPDWSGKEPLTWRSSTEGKHRYNLTRSAETEGSKTPLKGLRDGMFPRQVCLTKVHLSVCMAPCAPWAAPSTPLTLRVACWPLPALCNASPQREGLTSQTELIWAHEHH